MVVIKKASKLNRYFTFAVICFCFYLFVRASTGHFYFTASSRYPRYQVGGSTIVSIILYIGLLSAILLGIHSYRRIWGQKIIAIVLLIYIPISIWVIHDIITVGLIQVMGVTTINPFCFMLLLCAYAGMNDELWNKLVRLCNILAPIMILTSFGYSIFFMLRYGPVSISASPQISYLSMGFWPLCVRALCSSKPKKNTFTLILIIISFLIALLYNTRGWMIQTIALLFLYFVLSRDNRPSIKALFGIALIVVAVMIGYHYLEEFISTRIGTVLLKFNTGAESRLWQYRDLIEQYTFMDILFGKGSFATYETDTYGTFLYFDNAYVNCSMKYGVLPAFILLLAILIPSIKSIFRINNRNLKAPAYILFLFFFATMGVSVYCGLTIDLKFMIICMLIGRCEYILKTCNREDKNQD